MTYHAGFTQGDPSDSGHYAVRGSNCSARVTQ
jgi:hypothetical protein